MAIETITKLALNIAPASRAYLAEILLESRNYEEDAQVSHARRQEIRAVKKLLRMLKLLLGGEHFIAELKQGYR
jgi:hypothetical protein